MEKLKKKAFKSWSGDHNGKPWGEETISSKIKSRAINRICSSHHTPVTNTTGHILRTLKLLSTLLLFIKWLAVVRCSLVSLAHHI